MERVMRQGRLIEYLPRKGQRIRQRHQDKSSVQLSSQRQSTLRIRNHRAPKRPNQYPNYNKGRENKRCLCKLSICWVEQNGSAPRIQSASSRLRRPLRGGRTWTFDPTCAGKPWTE